MQPGGRRVGDDAGAKCVRPEQLKNSVRLQQLLEAGLVPPEQARTLDMDRLQEEEEDFTRADRERLALDPHKLKPVSIGRRGGGVVLRTIVGERSTFVQGKRIAEGLDPD